MTDEKAMRRKAGVCPILPGRHAVANCRSGQLGPLMQDQVRKRNLRRNLCIDEYIL